MVRATVAGPLKQEQCMHRERSNLYVLCSSSKLTAITVSNLKKINYLIKIVYITKVTGIILYIKVRVRVRV